MFIRCFLILGVLALACGANSVRATASPRVARTSASISMAQIPTIVEDGKKDNPRPPRPGPGPRDGGDGDH